MPAELQTVFSVSLFFAFAGPLMLSSLRHRIRRSRNQMTER